MDTLVLAVWQGLTYIRSVQTLDTVYKTSQKRWMIGTDGKRESGNFMVSVEFDDDDD